MQWMLHKKIRDHEFIKQSLLRGLRASRKAVCILRQGMGFITKSNRSFRAHLKVFVLNCFAVKRCSIVNIFSGE